METGNEMEKESYGEMEEESYGKMVKGGRKRGRNNGICEKGKEKQNLGEPYMLKERPPPLNL